MVQEIHRKYDNVAKNVVVEWKLHFINTQKQEKQEVSITKSYEPNLFDDFVCFVALRPKSTAMVMAGRSVHLTTLFPGQAWISS